MARAAFGPAPAVSSLVQQKLAQLPDRPGCYLFRNAAGQPLYVGKADSLRSRVRSYFQEGAVLHPRTRAMVSHVADLDVIVTDSADASGNVIGTIAQTALIARRS